MPQVDRPQKITLGEMRASSVHGLLVYCADYRCAHTNRISADQWPGHIRLSNFEPLFVWIGIGKCRGAPEADRGWKRRFDEPILLPRGRQLVTLEDAGRYITKLPRTEHETTEWLAAMEALILVATSGGPTMFARIGIKRASNRHVERMFNPDRKEHRWSRRKLARDR
jgi:hypothetical protein